MSSGGGSELASSLDFPFNRNSTSAHSWSSSKFGNAGIRPLPLLIVAAICPPESRSPTPTSDGIAGGDPVIFSPWQTLHWLIYRPLGLFSPVFGASAPVQAISFAFTYRIAVCVSTADPPHSGPPSNPGKITVSFPTLNGTNCPSLRNFLNFSSAQACASGVRLVSISSLRNCRAKGAGLRGNGCSEAALSPGTSLGGYLRYSM